METGHTIVVNVAGIIVIRTDGAVLLQQRDDNPSVQFPGYWCYPGGLIEGTEKPEDAARRELLEETGYIAGEIFKLKACTYSRPDGRLVQPHPFWTLYDPRQIISCREGRDILFLRSDEFGDREFIPTQKELIIRLVHVALKNN